MQIDYNAVRMLGRERMQKFLARSERLNIEIRRAKQPLQSFANTLFIIDHRDEYSLRAHISDSNTIDAPGKLDLSPMARRRARRSFSIASLTAASKPSR